MSNQSSVDKLKVLDLFSGIGGFSLGLERSGGFETIAFCEINKFCQKVLKKHWPKVPVFDDVTELKGEQVGTVDIICGGFPCQDLSTNGQGAGVSGERSGLWREMARLASELRPKYIIMENVANLLAHGYGDILAALASIGYDAEWHCIPAAAVGAPHLRDRIWIIANAQGEPGLYESNSWKTAHRLPDNTFDWASRGWITPKTAICRMDDGVPGRVDRTCALGNAVVPQIPEMIGNAILVAERAA